MKPQKNCVNETVLLSTQNKCSRVVFLLLLWEGGGGVLRGRVLKSSNMCCSYESYSVGLLDPIAFKMATGNILRLIYFGGGGCLRGLIKNVL